MALNVSEIINAAKTYNLQDGNALYLVGGEIVLGRDGCQPSNSCCVAVGPTEDVDWSEVAEQIEAWDATRR